VTDGITESAWSAPCYITLDKVAPSKPTITSTTFTPDTLASADLTFGAFTLAAPGATSFDYSWNGAPSKNLRANGTSGGAPAWTGNMAVQATTVGSLEVIAVDAAGNRSPKSETFYVKKAVGGKMAQYLFNDPSPINPSPVTVADTARADANGVIDPAYNPHIFNLGTDAAWGAGRFADQPGQTNSSLYLNGNGAEAVSKQRPVASERSFTIGAWVKLTDKSASRTLVAQDLEAAPADPGAAVAAYDIGYDKAGDRFVFHVTSNSGVQVTASDALPALVTSESGVVTALPRTNAWVYLAAIYDKGTETIRLDAVHEYNRDPLDDPNTEGLAISRGNTISLPVASVSTEAGVKAGMGAFRLGEGAVGKSPWLGMVDNLSVWQQALGDSDSDNAVLFNALAQI